MGVMAVQASLFHWIMLEFHFDHSIPNILVAVKTEFVPPFEKDKFVSGGMGVVAFYAIAIHHYFMTTLGILGYNSFVALTAYFVRIFVQ